MTYIVADYKCSFECRVHVGLVDGHEQRVDDDAQRDEEIDERVHDKQLDHVSELVPVRMTFPAEHELHQLLLHKLLLVHAFLVTKPA